MENYSSHIDDFALIERRARALRAQAVNQIAVSFAACVKSFFAASAQEAKQAA